MPPFSQPYFKPISRTFISWGGETLFGPVEPTPYSSLMTLVSMPFCQIFFYVPPFSLTVPSIKLVRSTHMIFGCITDILLHALLNPTRQSMCRHRKIFVWTRNESLCWSWSQHHFYLYRVMQDNLKVRDLIDWICTILKKKEDKIRIDVFFLSHLDLMRFFWKPVFHGWGSFSQRGILV